MLIRPWDDGVLAIGQASHAWLSGQIARRWGGGGFSRPEPYEEVCLAAEQHDVGMSEWDLAPPLQPGTGRPQSFMEMPLRDHLALWSRAPSRLLTQSSYAALLVSMHGTALYERRDLARMPAADAAAVRDHLVREREWQQRLLARLAADREEVRRNQRLLWTWDGLSLGICLGWDSHVAEEVPAGAGRLVTMRLRVAAEGEEGRYSLDPWPFPGSELRLSCEGRRLSARHATPEELAAALEQATPVRLLFTLVPLAD